VREQGPSGPIPFYQASPPAFRQALVETKAALLTDERRARSSSER
jgi:hypothetical protein